MKKIKLLNLLVKFGSQEVIRKKKLNNFLINYDMKKNNKN